MKTNLEKASDMMIKAYEYINRELKDNEMDFEEILTLENLRNEQISIFLKIYHFERDRKETK